MGNKRLPCDHWQHKPHNEDVLQISNEVVLQVLAGRDGAAYCADLRELWLESYKKQSRFQMTSQHLGTLMLR